MDKAVPYLLHQFVYRIVAFLRHWYIAGSRFYWHFVINQLEQLDYTLAWKITLKNLFQPLYGDYTILGYILGFIFRTLRLLMAGLVYAAIFLVAISIYLLWILLPAILIYGAISGI